MKDFSWSIMSESNQNVAKPQVNGPISVDIPRGWTRILENDVVLYISPTNTRLRSVEHVTEYLKTDGTCKCGLECPLYIHKVFNFDANVKSRFVREDDDAKAGSLQSKCKHYKENVDQNRAGEVQLQPQTKKMTSPSKTINKLPSFETLASEALKQTKAPARPRSRKTTKPRVPLQKPVAHQRSASPLGGSPPPITSLVNNNPVQCVPSNLGRDKGPLPSFASIVSSFFNPGANIIAMPGTSATSTSTTTSVAMTTVGSAVSRPGADTAATSVATAGPKVQRALIEPVKTLSTIAGASVKVPPTSLKSSSNLGTTSQVSGLIAVSAGNQQAKAAPQTVPALSSTTVTSVSKAPVTAAASVLSTVSTAAASRTTTRPIILGSSAKGNSKQSLSARGKTKATPTSKADARSVNSTTSRLNSGSSGPAAVKTTATVSSAMLTSHSSSAFGSQRPNLPSSVPVSFMASGKPSVSPHSAVTPHHGVGIGAVHMNPTQSPAMVSSAAAMTSVYQSAAMGAAAAAFQQPLMHRGPTSAIPVYAAPTAGMYAQPQQNLTQQQQHVPNVSQPQANVLGGSVHGKQLSTPASAFTQGTTSATVPQGTAVAAAASQTPGAVVPGVLVQGAGGSQLFQMNFHNLDMAQFKGAYQLQGALYQHPFGGNAMAVVNTGPKGAYGNVTANQSSYASPYMFGTLLMQQTTSQATAGTTSVSTATAVSVTPGATTYFNQNAAIAAALESFVPIAPAAAPGPTRYSQSLAHLASAYGQFAPGTLVRGSNPMQFPSMQVGSYPTNPMAAPVLTVPEYTFKYPVNAVKQTTYGPGVTTTTPTTAAKCQVPTTVVAAVPYVAFGQMGGPRLPIALNFTPPGQLASSQGSPGYGITVCGETSLATTAHPQYTSTGNVESKAGDANTSPGVTAISSSVSGLTGGGASAFTSFQVQPKIVGTSLQSSSAQPTQTVSSAPVTTAMATDQQRTAFTTASSGNLLSSGSTSAPSATETWTTRSSCMLGDSFSGSASVMSTTSSGTKPTHSVQNAGQALEDSAKTKPPSQKQTAPNQPQSVFHSPPQAVCSPLNTLSQGFFASRETPTSAASPSGHTQNESSPKATVSVSPPVSSGGLKRSFLNDSSQQSGAEGAKRTKYEPKEANYYETNPLLGLKRSCEAIEVYYESDAEKTNDKESKETSEKNCDGKATCDRKLDGMEDEFSSGKGSTKAAGFSELETNASFSHAAASPPLSDSAAAQPSALYNGRTVRVKESVTELSKISEAPSSKLDPRLPSKTAPTLPSAFQLPAFLGETALQKL